MILCHRDRAISDKPLRVVQAEEHPSVGKDAEYKLQNEGHTPQDVEDTKNHLNGCGLKFQLCVENVCPVIHAIQRSVAMCIRSSTIITSPVCN